MIKYGRKIIEYLFGRRSKRIYICAEFESKFQADCDRSDIRMFEARRSTQQYGDNQQSSLDTAEGITSALIETAKLHSLYIPKADWQKFGERKRDPSGESIVYYDTERLRVVKIRDPFAKSPLKDLHPRDVIFEHLIHNILFPTTRYGFIGITDDSGDLRIILEQNYIGDKYAIPTQKMIDEYLTMGLGLRKEDRYFYGNELLAITDVGAEGDNVLYDGSSLFFIDPIIKLRKPAIEILSHYYALLL